VEDGADILSLEELGLCGYERGDDFFYSDNDKTHALLQTIADYAASRNPDLVISVGHPWYFADKNIADQEERRKNPLFNRINNSFNVQTLISGGEIISMSAKRYLFNYERGYEKRHFEEWSDAQADRYENKFGKGREGTIMIELPAAEGVRAKVIPFGSPVVQIGTGDSKMNVTHILCEEYWVGSRFDGSADNKDYDRDNPLAQKARLYDITLALNPNASPPMADKIDKHYELCKLASRHCQAIVHTDGLGSSGSTFAQFGSRLMAQDGKIISEGVRCSMKDVAYTSQTVNVRPPVDKGHKPHAVIGHRFAETHAAPVQDGPAPWEKSPQRAFEEEMRNECLWLFDYMRKNKIPGFMEAVSGGADSAYNTAKVRLMVELGCAELGVEGFMEALSYLPYRQKVLEAYHRNGDAPEAIKVIMDNMLTGVYMGTSNSSAATLNAARALMEGGVRDDGTRFEGIGGRFEYRNVERLIEIYAEIYAGVNPAKTDDVREAEIRREITSILRTRQEDTTPEELARRVEALKSAFEEISGDVLSIAKPENQIAYENIQARLRQVLIMLFSNVENKLAIANPNLDEGRNSYATWGGDLHSGMISGNAHKDKVRLLEHMRLLHDRGLEGLPPVEGFYQVLKNRPSAELQPLGKDGKVVQFDEDQLGRSFQQMRVISRYMIYDRPAGQHERKNSPTEVFQKCRGEAAFANDDIETLHDRIRLSYERWGSQTQAKVHGSPIAATYGENIDHQSSLRTPNISANQQPEQAQLALYCLAEMAKRDGKSFEEITGGHSLRELSSRALIDGAFDRALTAAMSTPQPTGGNRTKIATLYSVIQAKGFNGLLKPTEASERMAQAAQWRKQQGRHSGPTTTG
jgi:NAD+ synthase (glutamine-hydrolysing)